MTTLAESESFLVYHKHEDVFLFSKNRNTTWDIGSHYSEPQGGLIGPDESWFITIGEGLLYFDFDRGLVERFKERTQPSIIALSPDKENEVLLEGSVSRNALYSSCYGGEDPVLEIVLSKTCFIDKATTVSSNEVELVLDSYTLGIGENRIDVSSTWRFNTNSLKAFRVS